MFEFMREFQSRRNVKLETIGLTYEDTEFGSSSAKAQKDFAQEAGMRVTEDIQYRARGTSLISEIQRLKAAQPDVWMPTSYISDAILMVRHSKEIDYNPKMVMAQNSGHTENAFIEQVGKDAEGYMSRAVYSPDLQDKIPILKDMNGLFRAKTNKDLSDVPVRVFLGMSVLADAINRAGGVEPDKIRQALLETDVKADQLPLPWKGVKFDPNTGQNDLGTPIIVQMQDGSYNTVWPFDVAAKEVIFPVPEWSTRS
jgi:branched-chain amino acid transport system substrate-binding protein